MLQYKANSVAENRQYWIGVMISVLAFIVGIMTLDDPNKDIYMYFPIVTLFFAVFNLIFIDIYRNMTWVTMIVVAFMFLRYCVALFILHDEHYPRGLYTISVDQGRSASVAAVMVYEIVCIYLGLYVGKQKYKIQVDDTTYIDSLLTNRNFSNLNVALIFTVFFTVALFVVYPSLLNNYSFIINSELDQMTGNIISSQAGLPSGMRWLGYTLGEATRYVVLEFIILGLYKQYLKNGEKASLYWWISVLITVVNAVITTQRMMLGIFMSLVLFYQVYQLYPRKRKLYITFGIVIGVLGILLITLTYWANTLQYQAMSQMIQGYTNGYYNVYQAYSAYNRANISILDKIEMFFVGDGLGNVNLISLFINGMNSSNIYNYYIYGREFNGGAVLPLVAQMSFYFSAFLGPIFSYIIILLAKKNEMKALSGQGVVLIRQFCAFSLAATPFMYNYSTLIHILTVVALPLCFFSWLNSMNIILGRFRGI